MGEKIGKLREGDEDFGYAEKHLQKKLQFKVRK